MEGGIEVFNFVVVQAREAVAMGRREKNGQIFVGKNSKEGHEYR